MNKNDDSRHSQVRLAKHTTRDGQRQQQTQAHAGNLGRDNRHHTRHFVLAHQEKNIDLCVSDV